MRRLFYSMIEHYTEELLPIVYTPAVGEGCQRFSEIWRRPRGLFISYPNRHRIDQILADRRYDDVRCIVVSDGERILGLGTRVRAAWEFPSERWRSTPRSAAFRRSIVCPSCWMQARITKNCFTIRSISAGSTTACAGRSTTTLSRRL